MNLEKERLNISTFCLLFRCLNEYANPSSWLRVEGKNSAARVELARVRICMTTVLTEIVAASMRLRSRRHVTVLAQVRGVQL